LTAFAAAPSGCFAYTVRARFADAATRSRFVAWLADGHLADVVRAGAVDAEIVELAADDASRLGDVEVRYHFADEAAFAAYERGPAQALRAEGRAHFPPESGISMTRSTGVARMLVVARGVG
jgi:hypothetical protein